MAPHLSARTQRIDPFHAVAVFSEAEALRRAGRPIRLLCVGEPDFPTPARVVEAAAEALRRGETHYTVPAGIPELRRALARQYAERYGATVEAERILVTAGASAAILLAFSVLVDPGDQVMMADPGYPSNRALLAHVGGEAVLVPVGEAERFQLTAELVARHWTPRTRAVMVASPANPSGTTIPDDELRAIHQVVRARGGTLVVDEIYHGLTYGTAPMTAAALGDDVLVVNSFSKYYTMTGWRLGWMVLPDAYREPVERLAQHMYIAAAAPSQWAGVAALEPASTAIYEAQRAELQRRRDAFVPALRALGFGVDRLPEGAFYVYADCSALAADSWDFAHALLHGAGVAVTPGRDFGHHRPERFVRFAYTAPVPQLLEALDAVARFARG